MAHLAKYTATAGGGMMHHYKRDREGTLRRENIDPSRTEQNYTLGLTKDGNVGFFRQPSDAPGWEEVKRRSESVQKASGRAIRKDAVLMADLVVTLPQNVPESDERAFFRNTYEFLAKKVGSENMIAGYVHKDESRPHMHAAFTPIVDGKFSFKKLCPRSFYQELHRDLGDYLEKRMGYRPEIELDEEKRATKELSHLEQTDYIEIQRSLEHLRQRENEVRAEIKDLQSSKEAVTESARYLAEHRRDGERTEQLRARIDVIKGELADCREGIERATSERAASEDRTRRIAELREGLERNIRLLKEKVFELASRVRARGHDVIWDCTRGIERVLRSVGLDARQGPPDLEWLIAGAKAAARAQPNLNRPSQTRGRGISR